MIKRTVYLRNKLTGNIFGVVGAERARDYFGSSNRTSDGKPIYERVAKGDYVRWLAHLGPSDDKRVKITPRKNPAPKFGKRKSAHAKPRKAATKKRVPFGRRAPRPAKSAGVDYVIRAIATNDKRYYWDGLAFDTRVGVAARYHDHKQAERIMESIENRIPKSVRAVDIVAAP